MKINLVTPAPRGTRYGNRVTALRWAALLRSLGHQVLVNTDQPRGHVDVLIALHARRSAETIRQYKVMNPTKPLILALTGTDVYHDIHIDNDAKRSLELADRIVTLQPLAREELPEHLRYKVVPIIQSARQTPGRSSTRTMRETFDVCVVGHLRPVKDPFRAAMAARLLPTSSRIRIIQVGGAMSKAMEVRAHAEETRNSRYRWLGEMPHWRTRRTMKRSSMLVLSSKLEGGANVLSEALVDGVPVIGSDIPGNIGLLGEDYPGYYTQGDTRGLSRLLIRAETDPNYLDSLHAHMAQRAYLAKPEAERANWAALLSALVKD